VTAHPSLIAKKVEMGIKITKTKTKTKRCRYYRNPKCKLVKDTNCESDPYNPTTCVDFIQRKELYGASSNE